MITRRHVLIFQPRFASLAEAGTKTTTIRPRPKRMIWQGDTLDLRAWMGKPYRSKQRKLREATCTAVRSILITEAAVWIDQRWLSLEAMTALAQRDGFTDAFQFCEWFRWTHGLPFSGVLIEWTP